MNLSKEAEGALRAMERAAVAARSLAAEKRLKLPVWRDGKIIFVEANGEAESGRRGDLTPAPHTTGHTDP